MSLAVEGCTGWRYVVERQVSSILAKLGARNRAELAALHADTSDSPSP